MKVERLGDHWRNIAISLKMALCRSKREIAWFRQLTLTSGLAAICCEPLEDRGPDV
jgi:hypothetical protein